MAREKKGKVPRKKTVRDPARPKKPWEPQEEEGLPFGEPLQEPGAEDVIWPACEPEDEDEL